MIFCLLHKNSYGLVSSKDVFKKYLDIFPNGIKPLWKFQAVVLHELNIYVKTSLFEKDDEIYIFSLDPPKNIVAKDLREIFLSGYLGRLYSILDDKEFIDHWLYVYKELYDEFEDPNNKLYLLEQQHKEIARYWLKHGCHDSTSTDPITIYGHKIWDQFIFKYVSWNTKIDDKHTARRWLC
jgi:hypothetical protein